MRLPAIKAAVKRNPEVGGTVPAEIRVPTVQQERGIQSAGSRIAAG